MINKQVEAPYDPFLTEDQLMAYPPERILVIAGDSVPLRAEEFSQMAEVVDWSVSEIQVLRDAAVFVKWAAKANQIDEYFILDDRYDEDGNLHLLLPDQSRVVG